MLARDAVVVEFDGRLRASPDDRFAGTDVRDPSDAEAAADVPAPVSVDEHVAQDRNLPGDATTMVQNDEGAPDRREI